MDGWQSKVTAEQVIAEHPPLIYDIAGEDRLPDWVARCAQCGVVAGPGLFQVRVFEEYAKHLADELRKAGLV